MTVLEGRVALVTGSARGIGAAIAERLARDGAAVAINYLNSKEHAEAVAEQIRKAGGNAAVIQADIGDPAQARSLVESAVGELGRLDILVNNAGITMMAPIESIDPEQIRLQLTVNVEGPIFTVQAARGYLPSEGGRVINITGNVQLHPVSKDMPIIAAEALAWLRAHLTENGDAPGPAPVRVHVGEIGGKGQWRDLADWPPPDTIAQSWHLHAGGTLAESPGQGTSSFRYDPHDPTPSVGGPRMDSNGFGSKDNGKLEARDDLLVFTGPVIGEPQEVIGPVSLRLRVRGSIPDFDVFARLCDVDAKGASWNICDGLLRLDATLPADADGWTEPAVPMSATAHRFAPGHRLRVQVSGGAHPRWARNTGTFEQIATATSLVPADIEISHCETVLSLPVLLR